ncbi:MAG: response regulator [Acidobacteriota bacterium]
MQDGEAALNFIHEHRRGAQKLEPCVILIDLYLPIYDGIAILRAIRQETTLEHIKVMVLTTLASPSQETEIAGMGAFYRRKPSALNDIIELASEIIELCKNSSTMPQRVLVD